MKTSVANVAAAALLLLPMAAADCDTFNVSEDRREAYTRTSNTTFPVSRGVNCTDEWARGSGDKRRCDWEIPRYPMGLVVHPYLDPIRVDAEQAMHIFDLVRKGAPEATRNIDYNETIVMNYTLSTVSMGLKVGVAGHMGFTPFMRCVEGTLTGCDDDGPVRDNTSIRACGYVLRNSEEFSLPPGEQHYDGTENLVQTNTISDKDPQPRYEDVAGNATFNQEDESSASNLGASFSALMAAIGAIAVLL